MASSTTKDRVSAIISLISSLEDAGVSEMFGLRRQEDRVLQVGDVLEPSQQFYDDEPTGEMLRGTCTIGIRPEWVDAPERIERALKLSKQYYSHNGDYYLVAGESYGYGLDDGEVIIDNPTVIAVL